MPVRASRTSFTVMGEGPLPAPRALRLAFEEDAASDPEFLRAVGLARREANVPTEVVDEPMADLVFVLWHGSDRLIWVHNRHTGDSEHSQLFDPQATLDAEVQLEQCAYQIAHMFHVAYRQVADWHVESVEVLNVLALTNLGGRIRLVELARDGTYRFVDALDQRHALLYAYSLEEHMRREAVDEFEELLNRPSVTETLFQHFFERHPEFITGDDHIDAHPHVALQRERDAPLVPDFLLEPAVGPYGDILELKPSRSPVVIEGRNHPRVSASVIRALAQLRSYHEYFGRAEHRQLIHDKCGFTAFRPSLFIVIGRRGHITPEGFRRAATDLGSVSLRTYDDILDRMKAFRRRVV